MKLKFKRIASLSELPIVTTTVGYWAWSRPKNKGTLTIYVHRLAKRRYELAVWGHELIEALYCWLFRKTTEQCDVFDEWMEGQYQLGNYPLTFEGGFHKKCPYRWGHILGAAWEYVCIYGTFAGWRGYEKSCNAVMGITAE